MITPKQLADGFGLNTRIIQLQTEGLTHSDSLIQAPYNINTLNWVLGHLAVNRGRVLVLLDENTLLTDTERARYETESEPIGADGVGVVAMERLLEIINLGAERISERLPGQTLEQLAREIQVDGRGTTVGARLFGLYFHDTYHTGQTDLLRHVSGKNDKII